MGESGLSPMKRALESLGMSIDLQSRFFALKAGLTFYHVNDPEFHAEIKNIDYTFQFDRRMLSMVLQTLCKRRGIEFHSSTSAYPIPASEDNGQISMLQEEDGLVHTRVRMKGDEKLVKSRVVVDATGSQGRSSNKSRFGHFNCNSVWTYYKAPKVVANKTLTRFDTPATKHILFPEGWMWMIRLMDFSETPAENLQRYIDDTLDRYDKGLPLLGIGEASEKYDLQPDFLFSIGLTLREDMDEVANCGMSAKEQYNYWLDKYPMMKEAMSPYELVDDDTWFRRTSLAYFNDCPVGDGFTAVGDAIAFSNPFLSRGMNVGVTGCASAARAIAEGLKKGTMRNSMGKQLSPFRFTSNPTGHGQRAHVKFVRCLANALGQDYHMMHSMFGVTPLKLFQKVLMHYLAIGMGDFSLYSEEYVGNGKKKADPEYDVDKEYFCFGYTLPFVVPFFEGIAHIAVDFRNMTEAEKEVARKKIDDHCKTLFMHLRNTVGYKPYKLFMPGCDDELNRIGVEKYEQICSMEEKAYAFRGVEMCGGCREWRIEDRGCARCHPTA